MMLRKPIKRTLMNRSSPLLFSLFSLLFIILLIWYINIQSTGISWDENIALLNTNWSKFNSLSMIWRLEALVVCGIAWVAFNLSSRSNWWYLVAIGHLLMLAEYIFMLGGYKFVITEEAYQVLNGMANWTFITSNLIWITGMSGVYLGEKNLIRIIGVVLTSLGVIILLMIYLGIRSQEQLISIAMPVVLCIYLLNTIYGWVLFKRTMTKAL